MSIKSIALALMIGSAPIGAAHAVVFTVDETQTPIFGPPVTDTYSFCLPDHPIVNSYVLGDYFQTDGYVFFNDANNGGFVNAPTGIYYQGEQLYSGMESSPTFELGTYYLYSYNFPIVATVTISVPEPSTWVLMVLGFGSVGFAGFRRKLAAMTASA
jgi:hypothetical protein